LPEVLTESIERVTDKHRETCDDAQSISPCAAVAMLRFSGGLVEYVVIDDAALVVGRASVPGRSAAGAECSGSSPVRCGAPTRSRR
jgi:hypothetical protein